VSRETGIPHGALAARAAPGPREVALIGGLAFFLYWFPGTLLQLASARLGLVTSQILFIAAPALLAIRWFYLDAGRVLPLVPPRARVLFGALLGAAGLNHLLTVYGGWQERLAPTPEPIRALFDGLFAWHGPTDFALLLFVFSVVPAACEEILFRGYLQAGMMSHLGSPARAILASGFLFGLFHLDPWRFTGVFVLGIYLAWLREATGSLWPSMAAHALSNAISITLKATGHLEGARAALGLFAALAAAAAVVAGVALVRTSGRPRERVL
jgi:CAAX protease family protein